MNESPRDGTRANFQGEALSWELREGVVEVALHRPPANEIGTLTLRELEKFVVALEELTDRAHALILYSTMKAGFSAELTCANFMKARKRFLKPRLHAAPAISWNASTR